MLTRQLLYQLTSVRYDIERQSALFGGHRRCRWVLASPGGRVRPVPKPRIPAGFRHPRFGDRTAFLYHLSTGLPRCNRLQLRTGGGPSRTRHPRPAAPHGPAGRDPAHGGPKGAAPPGWPRGAASRGGPARPRISTPVPDRGVGEVDHLAVRHPRAGNEPLKPVNLLHFTKIEKKSL